MTNNDELALKLKAAAEKAVPALEKLASITCDEIFDAVAFGVDEQVDIANEYSDIASPANILALLAERDADKKRIAELESENEYVRKRFKEVDLLFGKNLLVMKAAIIEWQSTGEAKTGLSWIFNTLLGPGELPSEEERDAQAYFDREYAPIDEELMALHKWFWERNDRLKAERAAAGIKLDVGE